MSYTILLVGCSVLQSKTEEPKITGVYKGPPVEAHGMFRSPTSAQSAMERAGQFLRSGNQDEALYFYVKALEFDDKNRDALHQIGDIHAGKGNFEPAEAAYRLALKQDSNDARALAGLGLAQLNCGKYIEARKSLAAAVAIDQGLWRAYNGLGLIADRTGDHEIAAGYYEKALKAKPTMPIVLNNLGYSRYLSGDFQGALALFDAAAKMDADYDYAWLNKGLVYARQGHEEAALQAFRHVLDEADAYNNLGYIAMMNGNIDHAAEYLEKAISLSPTYHKLAHQNLARLRAEGK